MRHYNICNYYNICMHRDDAYPQILFVTMVTLAYKSYCWMWLGTRTCLHVMLSIWCWCMSGRNLRMETTVSYFCGSTNWRNDIYLLADLSDSTVLVPTLRWILNNHLCQHHHHHCLQVRMVQSGLPASVRIVEVTCYLTLKWKLIKLRLFFSQFGVQKFNDDLI